MDRMADQKKGTDEKWSTRLDKHKLFESHSSAHLDDRKSTKFD